MKKYELIKSDIGGLYIIKALRDFSNVKKGDIGGYVESEYNLSHDGNCWIYDSAMVYNNAKVYGNSKVKDNAVVFDNVAVSGNAIVSGDSAVSGNARVSGKATVSGNTLVCDNAEVRGYAEVRGNVIVSGNSAILGYSVIRGCAVIRDNVIVFGNAKVRGNAEVSGNAEISGKMILRRSNHNKTPEYYEGPKDGITVDGDYINIGCQSHTMNYWLDNYEEIGRNNDYDESEIEEYYNILIKIKDKLGII